MGNIANFGMFRWDTAGPLQVYVLIAVAVLLLITLIVVQSIRSRRAKAELIRFNRQAMNEVAAGKGLSGAEKEFLQALADKFKLKNSAAIATSLSVFEECIQEEMFEVNAHSAYDRALWLEKVTAIRKKLGFDRARYGHMLESTKEVPAGQKLTVVLKGGEDGSQQFAGTLTKNDEGALTVSRPRREGRAVPLERNAPVSLRFFREGDGEYIVKTRVLSVTEDTMRVDHVDRFERSQQRGAVRVDVNLPVTFHVVPSERYPDKDAPVLRAEDELRGVIKDLSAGGAKIEATVPLPADAVFLNLRFAVHGEVFENVIAEILKVVGAGSLKFVNVKFRTIADAEKNRIFALIAQEQIWRKKGT